MGEGPYRQPPVPEVPALDVVVFPETLTIDINHQKMWIPVRTVLRWVIEAAEEGKVIEFRFSDPLPQHIDWADPSTIRAQESKR